MKTSTPRSNRRNRFIITAILSIVWSLVLALSPTPGRAALLPNRLVNNPATDDSARDSQMESTIAIGQGNTLFSAFVDTGSWDGFPGGIDDHLIGFATSIDGGANWVDQGFLPPTIGGDGMNPVLAHAYGVGSLPEAVYLVTTDFDATGDGSRGLQFFRFVNNGMPFVPNFMGPVSVAGGPTMPIIERPSLAVDNFSPPMLGQGIVYLAWQSNRSSIWLSRSVDGGNSFDPAIPVSIVGTPTALLSENFTAGDGGFTVATPDGPFNTPWTYFPGDGSWKVNQTDLGPLPNAMTTFLTSPEQTITQPGKLTLSFDHRFSFEVTVGNE